MTGTIHDNEQQQLFDQAPLHGPADSGSVESTLISTESIDETVHEEPSVISDSQDESTTESAVIQTSAANGGGSDAEAPSTQDMGESPEAKKKKTRGKRLGAIAASIVLAGSAAFVAKGMSGGEDTTPTAAPVSAEDTTDEVSESPSDQAVVEQEVVDEEEPISEEPEVTPTTEVVDETPEVEMVDIGNGFSIPATRTERIATAPEINEANDVDEVLNQITDGFSYVTTTGDFTYLENVIGSSNSGLREKLETTYNIGDELRKAYSFTNFYYHWQIDPTEEVELDSSQGGEVTFEARIVQVGFDEGPIEEYHYWLSALSDVTLRQKQITVDGETKDVWVVSRIDTPKFEDFEDLTGLLESPLDS